MSQLSGLSCRELVKALAKVGFAPIRQHGSHIILRCVDPWCQTVIPDHKELDRGTLRAVLLPETPNPGSAKKRLTCRTGA